MWPFGRNKRSVSLQGEMQSYGSLEQLFEETLSAYRNALDSVIRHTPPIPGSREGAPSSEWRRSLRQLRAQLDSAVSSQAMKNTSRAVDRELATWGREAQRGFDTQAQETKEAMASLAVIAEALAAQEKTYGVRFRGISRKLKILTTSNDIAEIRRKMQSEIELLEQYVDEMSRDSVSALDRLRQLHDARRGPAPEPQPEPPASAAPPRDSAQAEQFAAQIRSQVRTADRLSVIVLCAPADVAAQRADMIHARLADAFEAPLLTGPLPGGLVASITRLSLPESAVRLEIVERDLAAKLGARIESAVFEKTPGMSAADLLARCAAFREELPAPMAGV